MTRSLRILLAAFAAALAIAGAPVQGQSGPATITFNDPNCGSWGMTQNGSSFTISCQSLTCSISASPAAPLPGQNVTLTANCGAVSNAVSYVWSRTANPSPGNCPSTSSLAVSADLTAPIATQNGCAYKVSVTDGVNGGGSAATTLNWSTSPPAAPSGCSIGFTAGSASLPVTGGVIGLSASCTANTNGSTTWSWTKNGSPAGTGTTLSETLPANTLTSSITTTYQVTATNAGATPTVTTQTVTVAGTGGGGSGIDDTACKAAGYTAKVIDISYPATTTNLRNWSGTGPSSNRSWGYTFGDYDMVVVRFVAQGPETVLGAKMVVGFSGASPARLATLSTLPCDVATADYKPATVLATSGGDSFTLPMVVDSLKSGYAKLTKGVTYYVNIVNRSGYNGTPTCSNLGYSNCGIYIDFN